MWLEWPEIDAFHDNDQQILVGDTLLVSPVVTNLTQISIVKPPGVWYCYWCGAVIKGDVTRNVTLDDVPIWIRGGRIMPLYQNAGDSALLTFNTPLRLLVAVDERGHAEGAIYLDDGVSYDYENGEFIERNFTYDGGVLKSFKGNAKEKMIPEALKDTIINELDFYIVKPSGASEVKKVTGLNLRLADEWAWADDKGVMSLESGRVESHSVVGIVAAVCAVVVSIVVTTVVVITKRKLRSQRQLLRYT
jgi:hypothetical protein